VPVYRYIAKNFKGESKIGFLGAATKHELANLLREKGYILIEANLADKKGGRLKFKFHIPFLERVSLTEKMMFTRNLQVMISAGVSLPKALNTLREQAKSKKFKKALFHISEEVTKGKSFSESLAEFPDIFSELFVSMIKVGEEAGTLEEVLGILTSQMEKEHELKSKVKGAMIYPLVIVFAMVIIGTIMLIMVVPKLAATFEELNISLPLTTRIIINTGTILSRFWYLVLLGFILFMFLLRVFLKTSIGRSIFDKILLKIPIISTIIKKTNSASTIRTLGSLIAAGVPIVRSLDITAGVLGNVYYRRAIKAGAEKVKKGIKLSEFLSQYKNLYFPLVVQMIAVGEETGRMSEILQKLAEFYEEEVSQATKNLSAVIEPFLMIIIGAAVGFFVISMIQPMYSMIQGF